MTVEVRVRRRPAWRADRRGRVRASAGAVLALMLALLTACTGDLAAADLEAAFRDDPAVASFDLTSHDNQAFSGGVSGRVIAVPGLADAEVAELVLRLSAYTAANGERMRGRVEVVADGVTMPVTGDAADDGAWSAFMLTLRGDPRVESGTLARGDGPLCSVQASTAADAFALVHEAAGFATDAGITSPIAMRVRTGDGSVDLDGRAGAGLDAAARVWRAISERVPVDGVTATADVLTVTLADETDVAVARAVAAQQPDGPGVVRFASDVVRLGNADGEVARGLLAALESADRGRVVYVWASDDSLQVSAHTAIDLPALVVPLRAAADAVGAPAPVLHADGTPAVRLGPLPSRADAVAWADALRVLLLDPAVSVLEGGVTSTTLTVTQLDDAELARFAAPLRALAPDGARVCVQRPADAICVVAAASADVASNRAQARAFVDAWNAAG